MLVTSLRDSMIGRDVRLTSMLLLGVVGLVLALCCANVANLVLARGTARARELAVRAALGAGRRRIVAQLLTESLVLATLGGLLGSMVGALLVDAARSFIPSNLLPAAVVLGFGGRIAGFSIVTALVVGVLFGLVSAWRVTGFSVTEALTAESRTATGVAAGYATQSWPVKSRWPSSCSAEPGLLLRTLVVLDGFDPGYGAQRDRLLSVLVSVPGLTPGSRYPTRESVLQFFTRRSIAKCARSRWSRSVGWATTLPLGGSQIGRTAFDVVGASTAARRCTPTGRSADRQPRYFDTLELPIISGRAFTDDDRSGSTPVCIVNEAFARRHFPGRNPIGERIRVGFDVVDREIVGVARQVKGRPDEVEAFVQVYVPLLRTHGPSAYLIVRVTDGDATALAPACARRSPRWIRVRPSTTSSRSQVSLALRLSDIGFALCWLGHSDRSRCCLRWLVSSVCSRLLGNSERASSGCALHWARRPSA